MDVRLDGKVAIVTGGGGAMGRAYSAGLARSGAAVGIVDIRLEAASDVAASLRSEGLLAEAFQTDVVAAREVRQTVEAVRGRFGGIDILLNIAGDISRIPLRDLSEEEWDRVLDLNLKGMYLFCREVIPHMMDRGGGHIINFVSGLGIRGGVAVSHYAASKGGGIALTNSLARELRPHRITVNALAPGQTDTPMWARGRSPEDVEAARRSGDLGLPEDLVPFAVLLASDLGYQVTGHLVNRELTMPR